MNNLLQKCEDIIKKHQPILEKVLLVQSNIEILLQVKSEHSSIGKQSSLEGVICSDSEVIVIYPLNIWFNHCGLLPEPYNWNVFEEEILRVLAHEMRHLWQLKNGMFYFDNAENDADSFALQYLK